MFPRASSRRSGGPSGRSAGRSRWSAAARIAELDRLFAPLHLKASGVHGAEFRFDADGGRARHQGGPDPHARLGRPPGPPARVPGTRSPRTRASRLRSTTGPPPRPARGCARRSNACCGTGPISGSRILPGHFVFELKRPPSTRAAAIADFMDRAPFAGRRPVFIGDDVTDAPGFARRAGARRPRLFGRPGVPRRPGHLHGSRRRPTVAGRHRPIGGPDAHDAGPQPRLCPDRQLPRRRDDRHQRPDRLVVHAALRFRPGLLAAAGRRRGEGLLRRRAGRPGRRPAPPTCATPPSSRRS